jgi:ORF6N domain
MSSKSTELLPLERITSHIHLLRGEKVLFDFDLAKLYGVETKVLLQQVRRNVERFPKDFCFQLGREEFAALRSQFVTSKTERRGGTRYRPCAFTEQGVAMLSSVLRSPRAVQVNIAIMRAFVQLRRMIASHTGLARKLAALERKYDSQFKIVFEAIHALMADDDQPAPQRRIGFHS